ncbi:uncharacterized protein LOC142575563 isoform X2 [Dermacentor variabilis]|uniref:uncharacterized protein LOC142575563 isoform X2 n=1 Tax=Dermacentor variabilis TaxID=34621 RepID=UPI003F5BC326
MPLGWNFRICVKRLLTSTQAKVDKLNLDLQGKGVQAIYIDASNLSMSIDNLAQAAQGLAAEPLAGHTARSVNTELENMRMRLNLQERQHVCRLGHLHRGTVVTVTATGLTEDLSRRLAYFVIRRL